MRVTDRLMFESARLDTARTRDATQAAQELVSTGTRIQHPGDDPAGAALVVAFTMSSDRFAAIASAAGAASNELSAADGALDSVSTALSRARELAMQFSTSTYTDAQRAMGATEVGGLLQQIISSLNTRFGNRYIFAGTKDGTAPFQPDGTYAGDGNVRQVEVAPGVYQAASIRPDLVMSGSAGVLATLKSLQASLSANDVDGVRNTLTALDTGIDQVAGARSQVGVDMNALDVAQAAAKTASGDDQTRADQQGQVDLADAAIQLQATQNALQASLAAAAQSFRLSLLDYLR